MIDLKEQKIFKKFIENSFKFNSFDSTPTIGWSQIFRKKIHSKFVPLDSKIYYSIDLKGEKMSEKFDKNQFEICSIRLE